MKIYPKKKSIRKPVRQSSPRYSGPPLSPDDEKWTRDDGPAPRLKTTIPDTEDAEREIKRQQEQRPYTRARTISPAIVPDPRKPKSMWPTNEFLRNLAQTLRAVGSRLSPLEKLILQDIMCYQQQREPETNAPRPAWPSQATLARHAGVSESSVYKAIRTLKGAGILQVWRPSRHGCNRYRFTGFPPEMITEYERSEKERRTARLNRNRQERNSTE